ncbi:hypothetical protein [Streptomyces sp. NPDC087862]|uniref:hypothetical protein n=1 Tax=Streptomyces sp. NPDC087862 TaxID=3365813 RepID=UPI0038235B7E
MTPALYATLAVDTDRERARRELDHYLRQYYGRTLEQMSPLQAYAWGSAEECVEWLAEYVRAGARHVILRVGSLRSASGLKEIADQVLPMLRDRFDR